MIIYIIIAGTIISSGIYKEKKVSQIFKTIRDFILCLWNTTEQIEVFENVNNLDLFEIPPTEDSQTPHSKSHSNKIYAIVYE